MGVIKIMENNQTLKVCCISDTHCQHRSIPTRLSGDILIHSGDFTYTGTYQEVKDFSDWIDTLDFKHKIIIAGNHELTMDRELFNKALKFIGDKPRKIKHFKDNYDPQIFIDM